MEQLEALRKKVPGIAERWEFILKFCYWDPRWELPAREIERCLYELIESIQRSDNKTIRIESRFAIRCEDGVAWAELKFTEFP